MVAADMGEKKKGDAEKIQGKWIVVAFYHKGKATPFGDAKATYSFSGNRMRNPDDPKFKFTFELRPDKKPRELDVIWNHDGKANISRMIYELSGDTLKICVPILTEGPRPVAIGTAADDERRLLVLKRVKDGDKGDGKK